MLILLVDESGGIQKAPNSLDWLGFSYDWVLGIMAGFAGGLLLRPGQEN